MQRVVFWLRVKSVREDEYIRRHREVWPVIEAILRSQAVHNMSMFMSGLQFCLYMGGEDHPVASKVVGSNSRLVGWEDYMAPIMESAEGGD